MEWIQEKVTQLQDFARIPTFRCYIGDLDTQAVVRPDFDDSDWDQFGKKRFERGQGTTWVRAVYTTPINYMGIPIAGSQLRLSFGDAAPYFCPIEIFVDGNSVLKESTWMDCKCPEGILADCAVPGTQYTVVVKMDYNDKSYWGVNFTLCIQSDRVDEVLFHCKSIQTEFTYLQAIPQAHPIIHTATTKLQAVSSTDNLMELYNAIQTCRSLFEPIRHLVKSNEIYLVAHAHIDMNWFWTWDETKEIIRRDFTTMVKLLEEYPDFHFSQSQAAAYEIAKDICPDVFEKIKHFAKEGRWEVTASSWVEGDLNMACGESIEKHITLSNHFLQQNGLPTSSLMWCPDTFGHPATMPEILVKHGIHNYFFMRCGIGVENVSNLNYGVMASAQHLPMFWWLGKNGEKILAYNYSYTSDFNGGNMLRLSTRVKEKCGISKSMYIYGVGDHGGGPTKRDLSYIYAIRDLPTMPTLRFASAAQYFEAVRQDPQLSLEEYCGELNSVFEGCYTTHADIKAMNRRCESTAISLENYVTMAREMQVDVDIKTPLEQLWKVTLMNQFHDVICGAGAPSTYKESIQMADVALHHAQEGKRRLLEGLKDKILAQHEDEPVGVVFNPTAYQRTELVNFNQDNRDQIQLVNNIPPLGWKVISSIPPIDQVIDIDQAAKFTLNQTEETYMVTSEFYELVIDKKSGQISTLFCKKNNRYLARKGWISWRSDIGYLNQLVVQLEEPLRMSAWTRGHIVATEVLCHCANPEILVNDRYEKRIRFTHHYRESTIVQEIVVYAHSGRIDFVTEIDWHEVGDDYLPAPSLSVEFVPNMVNEYAVYEIPHGEIKRPTWDREYPLLRWMRLEEKDLAFAVLNDSKYGGEVLGNKMMLSLIRSAYQPDPHSGVGKTRVTYAILPYRISEDPQATAREASMINMPTDNIKNNPS